MSRPPHTTRLTRREMILLLGTMGAGTVALCSGATALLLSQRKPDPVPLIVVVTNPPTSANLRPAMVTRDQWNALYPDSNARNENGFYSPNNPYGWRIYEGDYHDVYRTIVVHHSVIYGNGDIATVRDVQQLHQGERGWADIGYHYLIGKDGTLFEGRDIGVRGTHVGGYNTGSVGVCVLGNTTTDGIPQAQWESLGVICSWLRAELPVTHIAGHRDFNPDTECPGDVLWNALDQLATAIGLLRGVGGYEEPTTYKGCDCGCGVV